MLRKLGSVALTYYSPGRAVLAAVIGALATFSIFLFAQHSGDIDANFRNLAMLAFPCISAGLLAGQLKWQFANPRAQLIPGYATPHLAIAGCLLTLACLVVPYLIALYAELNPLGTCAFAAVSAAAVVRTSLGVWLFPLMALFYSVMFGWGGAFWAEPGSEHSLVHILLLFGAWLAITGGLMQFPRLREEEPEYRINPLNSYDRASRSERAEQRRLAAEIVGNGGWRAWASDRWFDKLSGINITTRVGRVRLMRYGGGAFPAHLFALFLALAIAATYSVWWIIALLDDEGFGDAIGPMTFVITVFVPACYSISQLANRFPRMASEVLLPLSRREYINVLLLSAACDVIISWFTINAFLLLLLWTTSPIGLAVLATYLFLTFSLQVLLYGAGIWLMLCHSVIMRLSAVSLLLFFPIGVMTVWWETSKDDVTLPFLICGLIAAIIGIVCIQSARIGWREVEVK